MGNRGANPARPSTPKFPLDISFSGSNNLAKLSLPFKKIPVGQDSGEIRSLEVIIPELVMSNQGNFL
jgi:hypothetical protein